MTSSSCSPEDDSSGVSTADATASFPPFPWPRKLKGIIPPLVTPLLVHDDDSPTATSRNSSKTEDCLLDYDGTRCLLRHVANGGVSGVFILGSTGEGPSLNYTTRRAMIKCTCETLRDMNTTANNSGSSSSVDQRCSTTSTTTTTTTTATRTTNIPVLVGVSDTIVENVVALSQFAQSQGAAAVVLTAPYYFACRQVDLLRFVHDVIQGLNNHDDSNQNTTNKINKPNKMPIVLYNMPGLTKTWFQLDTVRTLAMTYPDQIVGIKDSSGNLDYFAKLCEMGAEITQTRQQQQHQSSSSGISNSPYHWSVWMGPEHLTVPAVMAGADGIVPGGANFEPRLFVDLYEAAVAAVVVTAGTAGNNDEDDDKESRRTRDHLEALEQRMQTLQQIYQFEDVPWFIVTKCACYLRQLCSSNVLASPFLPMSDEQKEALRRILENM